ncbi:class I SAM-dependent methyltransferase [Endozoicomonas arenosclerae]|uniref:class I SAM-dependent methyltransferase n=1 Tax=Endozoicomonas arenosclerae TaxID=1633495 RepID=UPI0007865C3A|nr:class I SAM-dependent methyltransferase [Endozoicomonas arenosclerae]
MLQECNNYLNELYSHQQNNRPVRVLEAGGGSYSHFNLPEHAEVITLDIEFGQLLKNKDAHLCVQGDIHAIPIKANSIDIIICFNVIEHLENPDLALEHFDSILKPGGLLILGCPVRNSLKGIITRLTPIGFHRWYYKNIVGKQDRGDGHYDAFPTPFRPVVSEKPLRNWCQNKQFSPGFFQVYDGAKAYRITVGSPLKRLVSLPYYLLAQLGRVLTLNQWQAELSDLLMVAEKQPETR